MPELVHTDTITSCELDATLLSQTVVLKLNGGLKTGMGLDKATSLLEVKNGDTFLDLTAKQLMCMREEFGEHVKFMLMNSFSTSDDTLEFFRTRYPDIANEEGFAFGGYILLPMIINNKTVDRKDDTSQKVVQLETAMGAASECFNGASAVVVPRTRFASVKKCDDLLLLRSDAYIITEDYRPLLSPACGASHR